MHEGNLGEVLILLATAVVIVTVFKRLQLSPVLGYLVAGGAIGPYGISIIKDVDATKYIAEFGIVFMLFAIGLELTLERLKAMRKHVFGFGTLQVLITSTGIGLFAYMLGLDAKMSIVVGASLAFSSTAIVLQILEEKGDQSTQVGRLSLAVLILQDFAVVPLLIMVPLLAMEDADLGSILLDSLWKAAIVLAAIFVIGMQFLRPLFNAIGALRSQELFTATTLLIVLGAAWATNQAQLSFALGAFIAGLLVAETEFRPQVESDIRPFKGLLMGLFFMTVGMSIDFSLLINEAIAIVVLTALLITFKASVVIVLSRLFGFRRGNSIESGLLLAQGSEFAFVLFALASQSGVLEQSIAQILLVVVSLSMALTPLLASIGHKLSRRLDKANPLRLEPEDINKETLDLDNHIIVAGFGRVGQTICTLLATEDIHNYVALDMNPKNVHRGRKSGYTVYYGDAERLDILQSMGIERAKMVVVTISDKDHTKDMVSCVHKNYPNIPIVARAFDRDHAEELKKLGANVALAEAFESSLLLGGSILRAIGVKESEIEHVINVFRAKEYPNSEVKGLFKAG